MSSLLYIPLPAVVSRALAAEVGVTSWGRAGEHVGPLAFTFPPAHAQIKQQEPQVSFAAHAELIQHVPHMGLDGLEGDHQRLRDLTVRAAARRQPGDLLLAGGQGYQGGLGLCAQCLILQAARQQVGCQRLRRFGACACGVPQLCGEIGVDLEHQPPIRAQIHGLAGLADRLDGLRTLVSAAQPATKPHRDLLQHGVTHDHVPRGIRAGSWGIIIIIEHVF